MEIKVFLTNWGRLRSALSHRVKFASLLISAFGVVVLSHCGRKSQAQQDEDNLKLVGYDLDQIGFLKAVENDDVEALKIFKAGKFDFNYRDLKGRTAAHVAAKSGAIRAIHFLFKNGLNLKSVDKLGVSPLMTAAKMGKGENCEVISYLLERGADARKKDNIGKFPLIHAMDARSPEAILLLAPHSGRLLDTGLLYAADQNHYETIPVLVRYGASVYARNVDKTGLMIAVERGHAKAVEVLMNEGANLYAMSDEGKLAKDYAKGNDKILALLVDSVVDDEKKPIALEWSEEELEELVQKAMNRADLVEGSEGGEVAVRVGGVHSGVASSDNLEKAVKKKKLEISRIQGKNLPLNLADSATVKAKVMMTGYVEKSLPIKVKANDVGKVELFDLRKSDVDQPVNAAVREGSKIGMTGLRVKKIRKKIVNNKLTGGQDKELVTLMIEDEKTGQLKELYAGYKSQVVDAVAVVKIKETNQHLIVERNNVFTDVKGVTYKVIDVNDEEVIIENVSSGVLTLLPLMGIKR